MDGEGGMGRRGKIDVWRCGKAERWKNGEVKSGDVETGICG